MFEKLQMEVLKKAAKLDGSGIPVSRPRGKFPYMYGYTDSGDLVIVTDHYACIIYKSFVYIDTKTVFRDLNPVSTNAINRMTDDDKTKPAVLTFNDLKIPLTFSGSSHKSPIFVYDEDGRKLGLVLPVLVKQ